MNHHRLILASVITTTSLACFSDGPQQASQPPQYIEKTYPVPAGNQLPDSNAQMRMHQKQRARKNFEDANLERKRQLDRDAAELLRLARELNDAVQNTGQGRLTIDIIHKAELIERLAHDVREKMKITVNGS